MNSLMKKLLAAGLLALTLSGPRPAFADTTTTRWGFTVIDVGSTNWGPKINTNTTSFDNAAGIAISNAFTSTNSFNAVTTFNATLQAFNGTAAAPVYTSALQTNKGMWFDTNILGFSVAGSTMAYMTTAALVIPSNSAITITSGTATNFTITGGTMTTLNVNNRIVIPDGSATTPAIVFASSSNTGIYNALAGQLAIAVGGVRAASFFNTNVRIGVSPWELSGSAASWAPAVTNSLSCGATGAVWTAVWATNGTIQTSHSSFKKDIRAMDPATLAIPKGIYFKWKQDTGKGKNANRDQMGWLADSLPKEAYEWDDKTGKPILSGVHESAVVGILCAHLAQLEQKNAVVEKELALLKKHLKGD